MIVGIDMVEIQRIRKLIVKKSFMKKVFSDLELEDLKKRKFSPQSVAAGFCAKEAFLKAVGLGIRGIGLHEVKLLHNEFGKPYINLDRNIKEKFKNSNLEFSVSLTHTKNYACAVVVGYSKEKRDFND